MAYREARRQFHNADRIAPALTAILGHRNRNGGLTDTCQRDSSVPARINSDQVADADTRNTTATAAATSTGRRHRRRRRSGQISGRFGNQAMLPGFAVVLTEREHRTRA